MSSDAIELNGKRYDAATGVMLGTGRHPLPGRVSTMQTAHHRGRSIDGFAHRSPAAPKQAPIAHVGQSLNTKNAAGTARAMDGFARSNANTVVPHNPEHSQTLKRTVVKMPHFERKTSIKKQSPAERQAAVLNPVAPKLSVSQVNPERAERSRQVMRHQQVAHFNKAEQKQQNPQAAAIEAAPPISMPRRRPATRAVPEQNEEDMFERAIAQATSHEQKAPKRRTSWKRKLGNSAAVLVALIVVGVFVAYLNLPTIELNLASSRAGFKPTMPNYKALGYTFDSPIKIAGNKVSMNFTSGDSQFTLTQEASNWDNQTLMDTLATQSDSIPRTVSSGGHTIYMTHTNQATWVSGGIRYDLTGNQNLDNQEITAVVDSM